MEVQVHRAFLTIEGRKVRLTKAIASQLPCHRRTYYERSARIARNLPVPKAICKLMAKVLDRHDHGWLILVPDPIAGLVWTRPAVLPDKEPDDTRRWDDLQAIPTVVL